MVIYLIILGYTTEEVKKMTGILDMIVLSSSSSRRALDSKDYINLKAIEESRHLNGRKHTSIRRMMRKLFHSGQRVM